MLFEGSCDHIIVNDWLKKRLIPQLEKPSIIIMDNAAFHKKKDISEMLEQHGHVLLPLSPYSPDFNLLKNLLVF